MEASAQEQPELSLRPGKAESFRFAMQRPALYLNELEACMEQILAETLEEAEKTA